MIWTLDYDDAFPMDPAEQRDTDSDGQGDNADNDDDGDGWPDTTEALCLQVRFLVIPYQLILMEMVLAIYLIRIGMAIIGSMRSMHSLTTLLNGKIGIMMVRVIMPTLYLLQIR